MDYRSGHSLRRRNWLWLLVALLFAINILLSASFSSMVGPDRGEKSAPAMSCHKPAAANAEDENKSNPAKTPQHLCCFTACIPLVASTGVAMTLVLPIGEPFLTLLMMRLVPRAIGVDPPPPKT